MGLQAQTVRVIRDREAIDLQNLFLLLNRVREAKTGVSAKSVSPFPFYLKVEKLKLWISK